MDSQAELKELSRQNMRLVWEMAQKNEPLSEENARLAQTMREHLEYADLWGRLDSLTDAEIERDGTNPLLHVNVHTMVEGQLAGDNPPEVRQAVDALMKRGVTRHEAIHRVGSALLAEIYQVMKEQRPFDGQSYVKELTKLIKGPIKKKRARK